MLLCVLCGANDIPRRRLYETTLSTHTIALSGGPFSKYNTGLLF